MPQPLERIRNALASQYRVERELGRGGMAAVYLAEDLKHARPVAIKVLEPDLTGVLGPERFLREIRIAAGLQHPHVLPLLDSGVADGLLWYVMPYVAGESLRARLDAQRQLPVDEAVRLAGEVARALDYSHRQGMVHRDIKPENILLADGHAVVTDFGIARAIKASGGEKLTQTGTSLGSPPYMSPEQIAGSAQLDGRSDLYSLGCVLHEMLAGQPPFTGPVESLTHQHLNLAPRPVRDLRPSVPAAVDTAIARALAKTPADRFATGSEFAAALTTGTPTTAVEHAPGHPVSVAAAVPDSPAKPRRGRGRAVGIAIVAFTLLMLALVLWRSGARGPKGGTADDTRRWVWMAEFDAPPEDPSLASAARDMVAAVLDESTILATVPSEQVRIALRNSGRPDSTPMSPEIARELAYRSSIPVVVEGRIGRIGAAYSIVLRATNPENGTVIQSASAQAASDEAMASTLSRVARDLRRALGERASTLGGGAWTDAATPSFEAFKLFVRGRQRLMANDPRGAIPHLQQALALDPEFAAAWLMLGTAHGNTGRMDSLQIMLERALEHPDRLSPVRRLDIIGKLARARNDVPAAMEAYDAILHLDPSPVDRSLALNNKGLALSALGRNAEALELFRESLTQYPIEPPALNRSNVAEQLIIHGRHDEALQLLPSTGDTPTILGLTISLLQRSYPRADSLIEVLTRSSSGQPRQIGFTAMASRRVMSGRLREGTAIIGAAGDAVATAHDTVSTGILWLQLFWIARISGREPPRPPALLGRSTWGVVARVTQAGFDGDSLRAKAALAAWPATLDPESRAAVERYAEGLAAWKQGRWARAVERLTPVASQGRARIPNAEDMIRLPSRWIVADAFDRMGVPDSALVYHRFLLEPPVPAPPTVILSAMWDPFVRSRVIEILARSGRPQDARREWETLASTCTAPDPDMQVMLDETRDRVRTVGAMRAGGTR